MNAPMHTKGPWGIETAVTTHWIGPMRPDGRKLDEIVVFLDHGPDYRPEYNIRAYANARLIAAAPELLDALVEAAEFIQPFNRAEALLEKIDAAIAKAKGEQ